MHQTAIPFVVALAAAAALLAGGVIATPSQAQLSMTDPDAGVTCGAFQRGGNGSWTAVAPTTLDYTNGMSLAIRPGQTFYPNQTVGGIEVTSTIDRQCGNM